QCSYSVFFFQAEDGIRDWSVTGVQTCALPISRCGRPYGGARRRMRRSAGYRDRFKLTPERAVMVKVETPRWGWALTGSGHFFKEIGRASCRERVEVWVEGGARRKNGKIESGGR